MKILGILASLFGAVWAGSLVVDRIYWTYTKLSPREVRFVACVLLVLATVLLAIHH
jgi:hypothetical protein